MSTHARREKKAPATEAPPRSVQASYGGCPDVTTWDLLHGDVYQCRCCGTRQSLSDLMVVDL